MTIPTMLLRRLLLVGGGRLKLNVVVTRRFSSSYLLSGRDERRGVVMSFGDGSHGALGLPSSSSSSIVLGMGSDAYEPTKVEGLPPNITSVAAGHYHSLAVTSHGEVWAWGRNHEFQLGRGGPGDCPHHQPQKVQGLDGIRITSAFASGVVSTAIGDDGSLWVWGTSKRGQLGLGNAITQSLLPSRVHALAAEHIVKVSFGWGHALACTKDGKLFGWGYSADSRLGHIGIASETSISPSIHEVASTSEKPPISLHEATEKLVLEQMEKEKDMPIIWEPCLVKESHGLPVLDVACGLDHSLVLCGNGVLLSGGSNTYGQLGRSNEDLGMFPVKMCYHPLTISAGLGHSLAVLQVPSQGEGGDSNKIVTWGWNRNSQLGRAGPENSPVTVEGLEGETPVLVCGGRVHSMALTSKQQVWVWGCGKNGRLGLGSSADESEPTLLEYLEDFEVVQAASGYDHNLVLVAES